MSAGPGRGARKKSRDGKVTTLYHVGDLGRPRSSRYDTSLEGGELSVSRHPREWSRIAGLGGNTYKLTKRGARFVDGRDPKTTAWAVANGYIEPVQRFCVSTGYDDEAEEERYEVFDTREEAEVRSDELEQSGVEQFTDYRFAPLGEAYFRAAFPNADVENLHALAAGLAPIFYARAHGYDGAWWNDRYAPYALSCPRGCILQERLPEWKVEPVDDCDVPDEDEDE